MSFLLKAGKTFLQSINFKGSLENKNKLAFWLHFFSYLVQNNRYRNIPSPWLYMRKEIDNWNNYLGYQLSYITFPWLHQFSTVCFSLSQSFSHVSKHQQHLEGFLRPRLLGPTPKDSDSLGLGWDLKMCISNRFPGDTDASGPGLHSEKQWFNPSLVSNCDLSSQVQDLPTLIGHTVTLQLFTGVITHSDSVFREQLGLQNYSFCQHYLSLLVPWATFLKEPGFSGLAHPLFTYSMKVVACQYQAFYTMSPIHPVQERILKGVYWHIVWHCHDPWVAENRHQWVGRFPSGKKMALMSTNVKWQIVIETRKSMGKLVFLISHLHDRGSCQSRSPEREAYLGSQPRAKPCSPK